MGHWKKGYKQWWTWNMLCMVGVFLTTPGTPHACLGLCLGASTTVLLPHAPPTHCNTDLLPYPLPLDSTLVLGRARQHSLPVGGLPHTCPSHTGLVQGMTPHMDCLVLTTRTPQPAVDTFQPGVFSYGGKLFVEATFTAVSPPFPISLLPLFSVTFRACA